MTTSNAAIGGGEPMTPLARIARDNAVAKIRYALATAVYRGSRERLQRDHGKRFAEAYAYGRALQIIITAFGSPAETPEQIAGELPLPPGARKEAWDFIGALGAPSLLGEKWLA